MTTVVMATMVSLQEVPDHVGHQQDYPGRHGGVRTPHTRRGTNTLCSYFSDSRI